MNAPNIHLGKQSTRIPQPSRYLDPVTGAHFDFAAVCLQLKKLQRDQFPPPSLVVAASAVPQGLAPGRSKRNPHPVGTVVLPQLSGPVRRVPRDFVVGVHNPSHATAASISANFASVRGCESRLRHPVGPKPTCADVVKSHRNAQRIWNSGEDAHFIHRISQIVR